MARFLITTALEETWRDDVPVLFLGEWCRLFQRRERWRAMDAEVLPYHWENPDKLERDYPYLVSLYERTLVRLGAELNRIHDVDHTVRYWRTLIGPWLGLFTQAMYDRWSSITDAVGQWPISETIVMDSHPEAWVPHDMGHFIDLILADAWNHHIYASIIGRSTEIPCRRLSPQIEPDRLPSLSARPSWRQNAARAYSWVASRFVRANDAFLIDTFLPIADEQRLQLRLKQVPQRWRKIPAPRATVDWTRRQWTMLVDEKADDFERLVAEMIPRQLPAVYFEGYSRLIDATYQVPWPKRPRLIFSSNALFHDPVCMAYAAENVERGSRIAYGQHGGNFWVTRVHWGESHEVAIADRYLSWGFKHPDRPSLRAGCFIKTPFEADRISARRGDLVVVTQTIPRYSYSLYSGPKAGQLLTSYFADACRFVEAVTPTCGEQIVMRLPPTEYGWDFAARWRERFPTLRLSGRESMIGPLVRAARLVVCTYCATTFLEAVAGDTPTVAFWDPSIDRMTDTAIADFSELTAVGVFHTTPESAAQHVIAIWDDVDAWWQSPAVRRALSKFKDRYCRVCDDRVGRLHAILTS